MDRLIRSRIIWLMAETPGGVFNARELCRHPRVGALSRDIRFSKMLESLEDHRSRWALVRTHIAFAAREANINVLDGVLDRANQRFIKCNASTTRTGLMENPNSPIPDCNRTKFLHHLMMTSDAPKDQAACDDAHRRGWALFTQWTID